MQKTEILPRLMASAQRECCAVLYVRSAAQPLRDSTYLRDLEAVEKNIIPGQNFLNMSIKIIHLEVNSIDREINPISFTHDTCLEYKKLILAGLVPIFHNRKEQIRSGTHLAKMDFRFLFPAHMFVLSDEIPLERRRPVTGKQGLVSRLMGEHLFFRIA